ncbi:hypothetical protein A5886_001352 [Enterococcus sp. 8G7_MSG3316]|uniref:HTH cro/C1-type domain-containing protein n=1 Tax=Candidatus Enterococcus testudinis TaxID=1834191 RepID=A0A242A5G2_9ENTE|nr:helix-turn-helix transcriptional regulator [Enterococcus sp. 8G7_MSG3316]OTN76275.1 hypothetical protein A5886_001352 [Enterococcus sp. 8G7_MSG3316]
MQENLGKHLKEYRDKNQLTQKELATILHVTDKAISKWERGRGLPDIEMMLQLAKLLNKPVEELLVYREEQLYFDYRSQKMWLNVPLMHLLIPNVFYIFKESHSVSDFFNYFKDLPWAKGWFSLGVKAKGCLSIGVLSIGLLSLGLFSCGLFSVASVSLGLISVGNLSMALFLAVGNIAIGALVIGNLGLGIIGLGNVLIAWIGVANTGIGSFLALTPVSGQDDFALQIAIQHLLDQDLPVRIKVLILEPLLHFINSPMQIVIFVLLIILFIIIILSFVIIGVLQFRAQFIIDHV